MILLGVDGGGTKTLAVVATEDGVVRGVGRAGPSNYQSVGEEGARAALRDAVDAALAAAGARTFVSSALGLAGFDGPVEAAIVRGVVERALGPAEHRFLENDALLVLRVGTPAGIGVGVVAGTGNNCIGRDRAGRRVQIGGMGAVSGDAGSAPDLALRAAIAAWRSDDGRAPPSRLGPALIEAAGVDAVPRLVDRMEDGAHFDAAVVPALVTALFAVADEGDALAAAVVDEVAALIAGAARAAVCGLSLAGEERAVVLGGTVFARHARFGASVARAMRAHDATIHVSVAPGPPVLGALSWAHDLVEPQPEARARFQVRLLSGAAL